MRTFGDDSLPGTQLRFHAQLWQSLSCRAANLDWLRGVSGQRDCLETNGEEATDAMEPAYRPEFPRRSHPCAEWDLGRCVPPLAQSLPASRRGRGISVITPQLYMLSFLVVERCLFPPHPTHQRCVPPTSNYTYPDCHTVRNPAALPIRTERNNPYSIATMRRLIAPHLARSLPRCPCCLSSVFLTQ